MLTLPIDLADHHGWFVGADEGASDAIVLTITLRNAEEARAVAAAMFAAQLAARVPAPQQEDTAE